MTTWLDDSQSKDSLDESVRRMEDNAIPGYLAAVGEPGECPQPRQAYVEPDQPQWSRGAKGGYNLRTYYGRSGAAEEILDAVHLQPRKATWLEMMSWSTWISSSLLKMLEILEIAARSRRRCKTS